uniref:hypothetical protein n=1 Tax=Catenella fusiformis TaxID=3024791 RepID=UPI0027DA3B76|nr:hypothetical protein REQ04_pgp016 [Catenella fusiformis]WCH57611.1 hypothetical protein [Catenella fusiformis]
MKKQILLVDDDTSLVCSISSYLVSKNFSVSLADTVTIALHNLEKIIPDLIIADIMMPNLDGYTFLQILRSNDLFYNIPVIFLTAKGMTNDRIKGYDAGCNAYLTKPFDPDELVSIINNLLKNQSLPQQELKRSKSSFLHNSDIYMKNLTFREADVLRLVVKGFRNKEIAKFLNISIRSVEKYVSKLLHKTATRNRTELAQFVNNYKGE